MLGRAPVLVTLGVLTVLGVLWAAAAPRPDRVIPGWRDGLEVEQQAPDQGFATTGPDVDPEAASHSGTQAGDTIAAVLGWATAGLLVLGASFCLFLVIRSLLAGRERRSVDADDAAALDLEVLAAALTTDADERLGTLSAGTPAQGIVAAWTHLEATLHAAGVPLPASRTSTEVSLDTLRRFSVDATTLGTLADLYREARWSHHPLTESDRERAAAAYHVLDDILRARMSPADRAGDG